LERIIRRPGRTSYTSGAVARHIEESPQHPNQSWILAAHIAVKQYADKGVGFEEVMGIFRSSDNEGMLHIPDCDLCIYALKNYAVNREPQEVER
jgi:hypothetical protein